MSATPLSRLNISCSCTECNTFLRSLPNSSSLAHFSLDLLPPTLDLGFSFPLTPAATPIPTQKCTPHATPQLRPTAPTLEPSPSFLLTRSSSQKSRKAESGGPLALPSLSLSTSKRVYSASRSLWAHISSPIDELKTPLSAKTPGLATCTQEQCMGKVMQGYGRTVCGGCEDELRGAVLGLAAVMEDGTVDKDKERRRPQLRRNDSLMAPSTEDESTYPEPGLFAVPRTPPSVRLFVTHSRAHSRQYTPQGESVPAEPMLFALPNTSLDKPFEDFTSTTPKEMYARDFPVLPRNSKTDTGEVRTGRAASVKASRSSREIERLARSLSKNSKGSKARL